MDPDPDWAKIMDPDPNWAKILDPYPNSMYLDPQHWLAQLYAYVELWQSMKPEPGVFKANFVIVVNRDNM